MCENVVYWKAVPGFPGYECGSNGLVRRNGQVLKNVAHQKGYLNVRLYRNGKQHSFRAHRLVMHTFCGVSANQEVNHKNGVKTDNALANLEICTRSENVRHAYTTGLLVAKTGGDSKLSTPIVGTNITTGEQIFFNSQACARRAGFNQGNIQKVLSGKRPHHKNYFWAYV